MGFLVTPKQMQSHCPKRRDNSVFQKCCYLATIFGGWVLYARTFFLHQAQTVWQHRMQRLSWRPCCLEGRAPLHQAVAQIVQQWLPHLVCSRSYIENIQATRIYLLEEKNPTWSGFVYNFLILDLPGRFKTVAELEADMATSNRNFTPHGAPIQHHVMSQPVQRKIPRSTPPAQSPKEQQDDLTAFNKLLSLMQAGAAAAVESPNKMPQIVSLPCLLLIAIVNDIAIL